MLDVLKCQIATNEYGTYCVPDSSKHSLCARRILAGKVYEPDTIEAILKYQGFGDVVHAGAYFGDMLPALVKGTVLTEQRVWAFEPLQENFHCAVYTLLLNALYAGVTLMEAALSAHPGRALLKYTAGDKHLGTGCHLVDRKPANGLAKAVELMTLDSLSINRQVTVIHLDVEGHEAEALEGARQTIERWNPVLIVENKRTDWKSLWVRDYGYEQIGTCHNNVILKVGGQ